MQWKVCSCMYVCRETKLIREHPTISIDASPRRRPKCERAMASGGRGQQVHDMKPVVNKTK